MHPYFSHSVLLSLFFLWILPLCYLLRPFSPVFSLSFSIPSPPSSLYLSPSHSLSLHILSGQFSQFSFPPLSPFPFLLFSSYITLFYLITLLSLIPPSPTSSHISLPSHTFYLSYSFIPLLSIRSPFEFLPIPSSPFIPPPSSFLPSNSFFHPSLSLIHSPSAPILLLHPSSFSFSSSQ